MPGPSMPEFFDVVTSQRACRSFREDAVPDEVIEQILTAATHAPSAENKQPWQFVVVRDPTMRARLGELMRQAWEGGGRAFSESRLTPGLLADVDQGAKGGVSAAPVQVVVCGDTRLGLEAVLPASIFPATQNLLLAANALGLGSALTTLSTSFADELRTLLDLPPEVRAMAVIPIGWPARPLGPPRRVPAVERAHRERFGSAW